MRKLVGAAAVAILAVAAAVLPGTAAHAASWCGPGWLAITSYSGPAGGSFDHMLTRVCIQKSTAGEYFAGDVTVYNGVSSLGQYNNHYGSRYVQFGTPNGKAMLGMKMGVNDTTKTIKGYFGDPDNNCYYGELMPGYQVTCASAWVFDNTPNSANQISGYVFVGAWFWQAGLSKWEWATGASVRQSSVLT